MWDSCTKVELANPATKLHIATQMVASAIPHQPADTRSPRPLALARWLLAVATLVLVMVAVGGIGSVYGVIVGTALLTLIPEFFRFISDYKLLVYGALLFGVMRFAPDGLAGLTRLAFKRVQRKGGAA